MSPIRISATVDSELLEGARNAANCVNDDQLIEAALGALLGRCRRTEVDAAYHAAYQSHPIDEPDEWGDLASFRDAAAR